MAPVSLLAWLLPSALLGWAAMAALAGRPRGLDLAFALVPSVALGASLSGLLHYGLLCAFGASLPGTEVVLACALAFVAFRRPPLETMRVEGRRVAMGLVALGLGLALTAFVITALAYFHEHPNGAWDAWDFWVMRARMIVRLGDGWRAAYSPFLRGSHPEYPPLWSMEIARAWTLSNDEARVTPWILATLHGLGSASLVGWAVARARGLELGLMATATLAALPSFAAHAGWQYADVPVAFHLVGVVAALLLFEVEHRPGWPMLAGLFAGLGALTKNEGALFALLLAFALMVVRRPRFDRRAIGAFALGVLPSAIALLHFRAFVAPPRVGSSEDFMPMGDPAALVEHVSTRIVERQNWDELYAGTMLSMSEDPGLTALVVALPVLLALVGWSSSPAPRALRASWLALALYLVFIEVAFVAISRWSVRDHVVELSRLVVIVAPVAILAAFAGARRSGEPTVQAPPQAPP